MNFIKNNIWTICCVLAVMLLGTADAFAQNGATGAKDLMGTAQRKGVAVFKSVKTIIFVVGGFGLVAIAFAAIFGKVDWKKFASLAVGLAILAAASAIVEYATGDNTQATADFNDTFGNSAAGAITGN